MSDSKTVVCLVVLSALVSVERSWADDLAFSSAFTDQSSLTDQEPINWDRGDGDLGSSGESTAGDITPCSCAKSRGTGCGAGKKAKPNPAATSHKGLFYANDFSYLNDPHYNGACLGDGLKLLPIAGGDWGTLDVGGQLRLRYHSEVGMGREGAPGVDRFQDTNNDFLLSRVRLYSNWKVNDLFRVYVEGIYAEATDDGGDYFPRVIEQNRGDFLNLFLDLQLTDSLVARVGRQELLYGNQRLVSPLDWANTRRTFDGVRLLYTSGNWKTDIFYTAFVPVKLDELDEADSDQPFYGFYSTYSGFENFSIDGYYLGYDNKNVGAGPINDFSLHTTGLRFYGGMGNWLWEFEGGPQFGRQSGLQLDHAAGFCTAGLGRKVNKFGNGTAIWFYYDYASGESLDPGQDFNAFNQLFPLAHKYFGFIDAVQRSNIESPNILFTTKPGPNWSFLLWYWHLMSATDAPVPAVGNTSPQNASKDLGDELDILVKYRCGPRSDIWFGWSHFWRGSKIIGTEDADFLYGQYTLDF